MVTTIAPIYSWSFPTFYMEIEWSYMTSCKEESKRRVLLLAMGQCHRNHSTTRCRHSKNDKHDTYKYQFIQLSKNGWTKSKQIFQGGGDLLINTIINAWGSDHLVHTLLWFKKENSEQNLFSCSSVNSRLVALRD